MNGACRSPLIVDDVHGTVGGAFSSRSNLIVDPACGASSGADERRRAPRPRRTATPAARLFTRTRIHDAERDVRQQRAEREEQRAGAGAAGDEVDVARAQRVEHQPAEARPRGDHFDRERSAEQRADDQAVDRGDRTQRRLERVAPDDARPRDAAREARPARTARRSPRSSPATAAARTSRRAAARSPPPARPGGAADRA